MRRGVGRSVSWQLRPWACGGSGSASAAARGRPELRLRRRTSVHDRHELIAGALERGVQLRAERRPHVAVILEDRTQCALQVHQLAGRAHSRSCCAMRTGMKPRSSSGPGAKPGLPSRAAPPQPPRLARRPTRSATPLSAAQLRPICASSALRVSRYLRPPQRAPAHAPARVQAATWRRRPAPCLCSRLSLARRGFATGGRTSSCPGAAALRAAAAQKSRRGTWRATRWRSAPAQQQQ